MTMLGSSFLLFFCNQSLLHYLEPKTGRKSKKQPNFAKPGQQIIALIETAAPVCVEKFADFPQLGRFTLRDEGKTIAIGKVRLLLPLL
jgi:peptide chain release factor subunit 3